MTSYPMAVLPLEILFYIFIAYISAKSSQSYQFNTKKNKWFFVLSIMTGLLLIRIALDRYNALVRWRNCICLEIPNKLNNYKIAASTLSDSGYFLSTYAYECIKEEKYKSALEILQQARVLSPDVEVVYMQAAVFEKLNNLKEAEKCYLFVEYARPDLLTPIYKLSLLYYKSANTDAFRSTAQKVLAFKPKIMSSTTERMVNEIKDLLKNK